MKPTLGRRSLETGGGAAVRCAVRSPVQPGSGNKVFDNILWRQTSYRGSIAIDAAALSGFQSDYNNLYATASGHVGQWEGHVFDRLIAMREQEKARAATRDASQRIAHFAPRGWMVTGDEHSAPCHKVWIRKR